MFNSGSFRNSSAKPYIVKLSLSLLRRIWRATVARTTTFVSNFSPPSAQLSLLSERSLTRVVLGAHTLHIMSDNIDFDAEDRPEVREDDGNEEVRFVRVDSSSVGHCYDELTVEGRDFRYEATSGRNGG